MADTTIKTHLEICEQGIGALRALETILGEALWHTNVDWISKDVCDGLSSLFDHQLDIIDNALAVIRDAVSPEDKYRSPFNEVFGETVATANRRRDGNV